MAYTVKTDVQKHISKFRRARIAAYERSGLIMTTLTGVRGSLQVAFMHAKQAGGVVAELDSRGVSAPIMVYAGSPWWAFLLSVDADVEDCMRNANDRIYFLPPVSTVPLPTPGRGRARWIRPLKSHALLPMSEFLAVADNVLLACEAGGQR